MARLTSFDINGTNVAATRLRDTTFSLQQESNGRSTIDAKLVDPASAWRPSVRDTIVVTADTGLEFGGLLWDHTETAIGNPDVGIVGQVVFADYMALLDKVLFNGILPAGTLASQLAPLITNMGPHGITLSPFQQPGPTLGVQTFEFLTIRQALDALSLQTGQMYRINVDGEVLMDAFSGYDAPVDITEEAGNYLRIAWNRNLNEYTNEIYLRYGPRSGSVLTTEIHAGDGVTRTFLLGAPLFYAVGLSVVPQGYVTVTRAGPAESNETVGVVGVDPAMWNYDSGTNSFVHDSGATLGVGETVSITYNGQFPGIVFVRNESEYAAHGPFTGVFDMPDILTRAEALVYAEAMLRRLSGIVKRVTITTKDVGFQPLQIVHCDVPSREVVGDFLITSVRTSEVAVRETVGDSGDRTLLYEIECLEGNEWRRNWEPFWWPDPVQRDGGIPLLQTNFCSALLLIWQDDFNGASALADDYDLDASGVYLSKVPGAGHDGSQAVQFDLTPGALGFTSRLIKYVTVTSICYTAYVLRPVGAQTAHFFGCTCGDLTAGVSLTVAEEFGTTNYIISHGGLGVEQYTVPGFSTLHGQWFLLRVEATLSTFVGPGSSDHSANGSFRIYINNALLTERANIMFAASAAEQSTFEYAQLACYGCFADDVTIRGQ